MNLKAALNTKKVLALVLAGVSAAAILGAAATPVHAAYTVTPKEGQTEVLYRAGSQEGDEETNWMVQYPVSISLNDDQKTKDTGYGIDIDIKPLDAGKCMKIKTLTVDVKSNDALNPGVVELSGTTSGNDTVKVNAKAEANTAPANVFTVVNNNNPQQDNAYLGGTLKAAVKVWVEADQQAQAWNKVQYKGTVGLTFTPAMQ